MNVGELVISKAGSLFMLIVSQDPLFVDEDLGLLFRITAISSTIKSLFRNKLNFSFVTKSKPNIFIISDQRKRCIFSFEKLTMKKTRNVFYITANAASSRRKANGRRLNVENIKVKRTEVDFRTTFFHWRSTKSLKSIHRALKVMQPIEHIKRTFLWQKQATNQSAFWRTVKN